MSITQEIADARSLHGDFVQVQRERFRLSSGQMRQHGWKNTSFGLVDGDIVRWIGGGDLSTHDLYHIKHTLAPGEVFVAGYKDCLPPVLFSEALGLDKRETASDRIYIIATCDGVKFDRPPNTIF